MKRNEWRRHADQRVPGVVDTAVDGTGGVDDPHFTIGRARNVNSFTIELGPVSTTILGVEDVAGLVDTSNMILRTSRDDGGRASDGRPGNFDLG
jgi:hypothetical protein